MDLKYTIKEQKESGEVLFTKVGHESDFTMKDVEVHMKNLEKMISEADAQIKLETATLHNISEHNDFIKEMDDEKVHACHLYFQAKDELATQEERKAKIKEAVELISKEIEDIKKQTGVEIIWKK